MPRTTLLQASTFTLLALTLANVLRAQPELPGRVSVEDRLWITSKIYSSVRSDFGHWQGVPDLDLDMVYRRYLAKAAATDDRLAFDLATMEFFAELRNGHTYFSDDWLWMKAGPLPGFQLEPLDGKWVVRWSRVQDLEAGDTVLTLDGKPIDGVVREKAKLVAASSERAGISKVFFAGIFWPDSFKLGLTGNREVVIVRREPKWKPNPPAAPIPKMENGVAYHRISSFGDPQNENAAIDALKANSFARVFIFDVRGNGGGSTPERLLRAVMDRPYRGWMEAGSVTFGLFYTYGDLFRNFRTNMDERSKGFHEGFAEYFERPYFVTPGTINKPENPIFRGRMLVLTDRACASACEDFIMPLKTSGRATLIGEASFGSSGQPFMYDFGNGMSFRVSTKRMYLANGSEFEGVGIHPDIEIVPAIDDIRANRDVVLQKAIELAPDPVEQAFCAVI